MDGTQGNAHAPVTAPNLASGLDPLTAPQTGSGGMASGTIGLATSTGTLAPADGAVPARANARPGVVQLAIREKAALYAAYMPFIDGGGLFVPTTRAAHIGDELYLILSLIDEPGKLPVTGTVVWVTPSGTPGRQQGLGIQFTKDEAGVRARSRIEDLLGGALKANRPTHTV